MASENSKKNGKTPIFVLTRNDVVTMIRQLHPEVDAEKVVAHGDFLRQVQKGIESGLECWDDVMRTAIEEALPNINRQQSLNLN